MCIMRPITACAVAAVATLFTGTVAAQAMTVTCESINYRDQQCPVPGGPVALVRQLSTPPGDCIEGRTWGFDRNSNRIWVANGCRAEFRIAYRDREYSDREYRDHEYRDHEYRDHDRRDRY
jgi:hypothetical protein